MKKRAINWESLQADFTKGSLSNRQLAKKFGVSEGAIRKKAKENGWVRTKTAKQHRSSEVLIGKSVTVDVLPIPDLDPADHAELITQRLLSELDTVTSHVGELADMIEEATASDENGRRRDAMMKAISLPARSMTLKTIVQAHAILKEMKESGGKKKQREDEAKSAVSGGGRFATRRPPKLVVNNE